MSDAEKATVRSDSTVVHTPRPPRIADPIPLGLFSFSSTLFVLSLYNVHARHITVPNVIVGMGLFYGGLAQLLAGMWSFVYGSTLAATGFSTYGAFFMSYATLLIPDSGVLAAYTDPEMFANAVGIQLMAFMIVSLFFTFSSMQHSVAYTVLFSFVVCTFIFLGAAQFTRSSGLTKAGGTFGIIASMIGYYCGLAPLLGYHFVIPLPLGLFKRRTA